MMVFCSHRDDANDSPNLSERRTRSGSMKYQGFILVILVCFFYLLQRM